MRALLVCTCTFASAFVLNACASVAPQMGTNSLGQSIPPAHPATQQASKGPSHDVQLSCNSAPNLLYVSQTLANTVNIYNSPPGNANPPPLYTINASQGLSSPQGMISDIATTILYVANYGAQNVLLFKKCGTGPGATLIDAPFNPTDVAISPGSSGAVYVSNDSPANVTVFPIGSPNYVPALTLTDPNASNGVGITIDRFGNCFWSFMDSSGQGQVDRFVNCTMPGVTIALFTPIVGPPGGVQLDFPANRLLVNYRGANRTHRVASPWTGPGFLFPQVTGAYPYFLSLRTNETRLYVADSRNGAVQRYIYPSGTLQLPLTNGLTVAGFVSGVAVYPAAPL